MGRGPQEGEAGDGSPAWGANGGAFSHPPEMELAGIPQKRKGQLSALAAPTEHHRDMSQQHPASRVFLPVAALSPCLAPSALWEPETSRAGERSRDLARGASTARSQPLCPLQEPGLANKPGKQELSL